MPILTINTKADISEFVKGQYSGKDALYELQCPPIGRLAELVSYVHKLSPSYESIAIEVKFDSKYNDRVKRLEIVGKKGDSIVIYKVSTPKRYDKDAIDMDRNIQELKELYPNRDFVGTLILSEDTSNISFFEDSLKSMGLSINVISL